MSQRVLRNALVLGGVFVAGLLGAGAAEAQTPKRGGIFTLPTEIDPPTFDCQAFLSIGVLAFVKPVYSQLVRYDQNNYPNILGDLAESWTASPDGLTYTFKLRPNVKFHDGSPFGAVDIKATYDRLINPPQGILSIRRGEYTDITSIEVVDPLTVAFKLSSRNAAIVDTFANSMNCVYSARKLAANIKYPDNDPMGTGPFVFEGYAKGAGASGKRFADYFRPGLPYLDGYKVVVFSGDASIPAMAAGQVDGILRVLAPVQIETIKAARGDKVTTQQAVVSVLSHLSFNVANKPFDDVRVRRALSMMIDRKAGLEPIKKITNQATDGGVVQPSSDRRIPDAELQKLMGVNTADMNASRAEARRLLAEAGQSNIKFKLFTRNQANPWLNMAIFVQDQWRQSGLAIELDSVEQNTYLKGLAEHTFDVAIDTNSTPSDDPTIQLVKFTSSANNNYGLIRDPTLDDLFQKQKVATTPVERKTLVQSFERRILEQAYIGPLYWAGWTVPLGANIHNWKPTPSFYLGYDLTEVWKD